MKQEIKVRTICQNIALSYSSFCNNAIKGLRNKISNNNANSHIWKDNEFRVIVLISINNSTKLNSNLNHDVSSAVRDQSESKWMMKHLHLNIHD